MAIKDFIYSKLKCYKTWYKVKDYFVKPTKYWKFGWWPNVYIGYPSNTELKIFDRYLELPMCLTSAWLDKDVQNKTKWDDFVFEREPYFGVVLFGFFFGFILRYKDENKFYNTSDYFESMMYVNAYGLEKAITDNVYIEYPNNVYEIKLAHPELKKEYLVYSKRKQWQQIWDCVKNKYDIPLF